MPKRLLLTGATGFLGRNVRPVLETHGYEVHAVSRRDADLLDAGAAARLVETARPRVVVHLAGLVGGIGANLARPADFCHQNLLLNAHLIDAAARAGVEKVVALVGGCSYPAAAPHPIPESALWSGYPQAENAPYSAAKRMVAVLLEAYEKQYGLGWAVAIPGNVYGPFDNFAREESHVVPAMIRRFHEAKEAGHPSVTCWGTGAPTRDFLYAGDLAACLPFLIRHEEPLLVNIARGETTSIAELARVTAEVVGYTGTIAWDASRPDGQSEKVLDNRRMRASGLECPTTLREGLARTYAWVREHLSHGAPSGGLRW
jgi:GDP-L-fucose synthase